MFVMLERVCTELKILGFAVDIDMIKKYNPFEFQVLDVEKNLWNLFRGIMACNNHLGGIGKASSYWPSQMMSKRGLKVTTCRSYLIRL